jgi:hypothetical protein
MAKRPRDFNQMAKLIVDIASGDADDTVSDGMRSPVVKPGVAGGKSGGMARAASLSPEDRSSIAQKAARTRWQRGKE